MATKHWFSASMEAYRKAAVTLYPGTQDAFMRDVEVTKSELLSTPNDKKKMFYFLRNCKDFSDPQPETVLNAVTELELR